MKRLLLLGMVSVGFGQAFAVDAVKYQCKGADYTRTVEVQYPQMTDVPCQVMYERDAAGPQKTYWANGEAGYCEQKAQGLVDKLSQSGYQCQKVSALVDAAPADAAAAPAAPTEPMSGPEEPVAQ
ncbi:MAG: hypothetical protein HYW48_00490 [Deltaproteobacteria bacterium]|nr:hypothetical protein [Deltaproteobacteria bacterium]